MPYIVVVRRGETEVFRTLREHGAIGELSDVIWDRRIAPRRATPTEAFPSDRRQRDRRGRLPVTWAPLGFVLVSPECPERP